MVRMIILPGRAYRPPRTHLDPGPPARRGPGGLKILPWAIFSAFSAPGPEALGPGSGGGGRAPRVG